jgi:hypothetical protein
MQAIPAAAASSPWRIEQTPNPALPNGGLAAVSCSSAATCIAAGSYENGTGDDAALAERWDGSTWTVQPTPDIAGSTGSGLAGVSCTSATACTAVGYNDISAGPRVTLAEAWNGRTWSVQDTPSPAGGSSGLNAVSCHSGRACAAVSSLAADGGSSSLSLAETWDGGHWTIQPTANPAGARPSAISAVRARPPTPAPPSAISPTAPVTT